MIAWIAYVWCRVVAFFMLKTFGVTVEEITALRRCRRENDRLRSAFVRSQLAVSALEKKIRSDADTLPCLPASTWRAAGIDRP